MTALKIIRRVGKSFSVIAAVAFFCSSSALAQTGAISGTVVDSESGESLIGANVVAKGTTAGTITDYNGEYELTLPEGVIQGTTVGAQTDLDGQYEIRSVEPGTYAVEVSYIGYNKKTIEGVEVQGGEVTRLDVRLVPEAIGLEEVVVEAEAARDAEAGLLKERQKAAAVSDAISAEAISRSGSSTASDAMQKVTGASVVGGKYVYVRGLGDRYMNTQLNGADLPSADPDKNAVPLDLFPSSLLDNIVTIKTFTPDKPASFSGGTVNIGTKAYPESFALAFSSSISYRPNVGLGGDFLSYAGGEAGVLGMNGGTHYLPEQLEGEVDVPPIGEAYTDSEKARRLDELSSAFNEVMAPALLPAPLDQSYTLSLGNRVDFLGRPLGVVASLSYNRDATGYGGGTTARYLLTGKVSETDDLANDYLLTDQRGTDEVLWGGLVNLSYKPSPMHELGFNYMHNHSGESMARYQWGTFPRDLTPDAVYETRVLQYVERRMNSFQGRGAHAFTKGGLKFDWNTTISRSIQNEPDLRFFTNNYTMLERNGVVDTVYAIRPSIYPVPTRYFRDMEEGNWTSNASLAIPFKQWEGLSAQLKVGGGYSIKDRTFRERRFEYRQDKAKYDGNPGQFFASGMVGILPEESTEKFFRFGNYILDATTRSSNYDGDLSLASAFAMIDMPVLRRVRVVGGLRMESFNMQAVSQDSLLQRGELDNLDLLPSANLVYEVYRDMNLRLAYGKTLARPTFREIAPYASFNFVGDYIFIGNPELERTLIDNYDLRWEWFARPGELYAISAFAKLFSNPIERAINPIAANPEIQYRNVENARVVGLEFEARKRLDQIAASLSNFQVGANLALVHSQVDIAEDELSLIRAFDPDADDARPLQGQSPFTINLDATYDNRATGTTAAPHAASSTAMASPIPLLPPVTTATEPSSEKRSRPIRTTRVWAG